MIATIKDATLILHEFDKHLLFVQQCSEVTPAILPGFDAAILDAGNEKECLDLLKNIRATNDPAGYLKPVFVINWQHCQEKEMLAELSDGLLNSVSIVAHLPLLGRVEQLVEKWSDNHQLQPGMALPLLKAMRFAYSRNRNLTPVPSRYSLTGYMLPVFDVNFSHSQFQEYERILQYAIQHNLLSRKFVDKLHLCGHCSSGYLNYRETCPSCHSHHLHAEHVIHHFMCANVGPESDYVHGDHLSCPKCSQSLGHLGTDYDRPSMMMTCQTCYNAFQEPDISAFCVSCKHVTPIDQLKEHIVYEYALTPAGVQTIWNESRYDLLAGIMAS
ncbi:hypothetical protein [Chitinophaga sp. HK235]|uniref:TackOD1 domain-containing metal-binding protein n=1 Tax=Chitinophaga sp. HK235 TaxID=2952571 RepID=UPI001BA654BE|nr:hypothetical protein [Chitinophaga sp. HK235]